MIKIFSRLHIIFFLYSHVSKLMTQCFPLYVQLYFKALLFPSVFLFSFVDMIHHVCHFYFMPMHGLHECFAHFLIPPLSISKCIEQNSLTFLFQINFIYFFGILKRYFIYLFKSNNNNISSFYKNPYTLVHKSNHMVSFDHIIV